MTEKVRRIFAFNMIKNKRILIAGGGGSIGSELVRQLSIDNKIFILDINETGAFDLIEELQQKDRWVHGWIGDIKDRDTVRNIFSDFKPEIVINAAALKHVKPSQIFPREYVMTNIVGNLNLIEASQSIECFEKFVFISTDKAVNSKKNVMGATKMCSETITTALGSKFIAVRFGNVLNSRGSLIPIWQRQINDNQPITITDERMERFFMTIEEACSLVIEATEKGQGGEVFVMDMGEKIKIVDLAKKIIAESRKDIEIKTIGIRPGETLSEEIMTADEREKAEKDGRFFILK